MAAPSYLHGPLSVHQQLDGLSCVRNLCREAMPPPLATHYSECVGAWTLHDSQIYCHSPVMIPVDARGGDPFTGTNCPLENDMRTVAAPQ